MKSELTFAGLAGVVILLMGFCALGISMDWLDASQWLLQAGLLWGFAWWQTWQRLGLNRPHRDAPLFFHFGLANYLTLLRGGLIALTGGFLFNPQADGFIGWVPGLLYGLAAILDRVDGFVARKSKQTSVLGAELDTVFDALGLVIAPLLAVCYGKIHWSYLLLSVAYYLFQAALKWRRGRGFPVYPMFPSMLRRALAGFQMGFIALVLFPVFLPSITRFCGFVFMLPVLAGFVIDWLVVTGRIRPLATPDAQPFRRFIKLNSYLFLPALRLVLAICLIAVLYGTHAFPLIFTLPGGAQSLLVYGLLASAVLVLFGVAGRVCSLGLLVLLSCYYSIHYATHQYQLVDYVLLWSCAWVMLLGTGRFNLWRWDDVWINRHDGA